MITFYSVSILTAVFKKFHDKIKVLFYVRSSIQRIQYWECKQRLRHVIVYKISKNDQTPWYILDLKHSTRKFCHLNDKLMTIQNYDML
jgi:hypothetical protein